MISILMPIYNGIEFLEESYDSIVKQTFTEWELLIGINGHEENSVVYKKALETTKGNIRVKIFDFKDIKGKSNTLNEMIKLCNNDIICLLDVDDAWHPTKLEKQVKYINKYDVIGTDCKYFGDRSNKPYLPFGAIDRQIFFFMNPIINSSSMFKKGDAFWDASLDGVEDYDLWTRMAIKNKSFFNINETLCYHRIHKTSSFNTKNFNALIEKIKNKWN